MDANTIRELDSHLNADEGLVGPTSVAALRLLGSPQVVSAFAEAARALAEAQLDDDEVVVEIVERALVLRIAVAERWERAGASAAEHRAAGAADRAIEPHRGGLLLWEHAEQYCLDCEDFVALDHDAWWGWLASSGWADAGDDVAELLGALADQGRRDRRESRPAPTSRSEDAWGGSDGLRQCGVHWCSLGVHALRAECCHRHQQDDLWDDAAYAWSQGDMGRVWQGSPVSVSVAEVMWRAQYEDLA